MPAAESADPTPAPGMNTHRPAPVIHLDSRRPDAKGRWTTMNQEPPPTTPDPGPAAGGEGEDAVREIAHRIEAVFNSHFTVSGKRATLSDPDTAAAFAITVDVLADTLHGARAQGIITAKQLEQLLGLAQGIKQAPHLL